MAWTPISGLPIQYFTSNGVFANGYYLKFYQDGTTTPTNMASASDGSGLLAKCQINSSGYAINGSSAVFIPHIDQDYKAVLYKNATDADNDTTGNADWVVDNIKQLSTSGAVVTKEYQLGSSASSNVFTLGFSYVVGNDEIEVLRNGVELRLGALYDYTETSTTQVTIDSDIEVLDTDTWLFKKVK